MTDKQQIRYDRIGHPNTSYNNWTEVEQDIDALKAKLEEVEPGIDPEFSDIQGEPRDNDKLKAELETLEASIDDKVDKETGKGLSTNDYTDADKAMLAEHDTEIGELQAAVDNKVDKETGKGLSSNDFTDGYKVQISDNTNRIADAETRLAGHDADVTRIDNEIGSLDATKADQASLEQETQDRLEAESQLQGQIDDKADKTELDDYIAKTEIQDDGAIELGPNGLRVKVDGQTIVIANGQLKAIVQGGGGGGNAYWGGITGQIEQQADLIAELKKKITYGSDVPPEITQALRNTIYVYTGPTTEEEPIYVNSHIYYSAEVTVEEVTEWKWIDITAGWLKPLEEKDAEQDVRMTNIEAKDTEQDSAITQLQADLQDEIDDRTGGDEALASRISAVENELPNKADKSTTYTKDEVDAELANKVTAYNATYTGKTRNDILNMAPVGQRMFLNAVEFSSGESPIAGAYFYVEVVRYSSNGYGYIIATRVTGSGEKFASHKVNGTWSSWASIDMLTQTYQNTNNVTNFTFNTYNKSGATGQIFHGLVVAQHGLWHISYSGTNITVYKIGGNSSTTMTATVSSSEKVRKIGLTFNVVQYGGCNLIVYSSKI